jgi:EpsI family protein
MNGYRWWSTMILILAAAVVCSVPRADAVHPALLQNLPSSIDGWTSEDISIEPRLVAASSVDNYLNRVYSREPGEQIGLYVAYFKSQRAGDSVHSPKNCLPGAGWQPIRSSRIALPFADGRLADANLYIVENDRQRYVVLYWYQSHGSLIASEYRAKYHTIRDAILYHRTDSTLVRITVPVQGDETRATQSAIDFASLIAPRLDEILPR